jgi:hypothetical protein
VVARQSEACSSVHLARDPFGLGLDVPWRGSLLYGSVKAAGGQGVEVPLQAPGEGVSLARSWCCAVLRLSGLVSSIRASRRGEM